MTEIILCNQPLVANQLENQCGLNPEFIGGVNSASPALLTSYKPYLMCEDPTAKDRDILQLLSSPQVSREVTNFSLSYGEDNTLAIAEIYDKLQTWNIGLMGAGTAVYGQRLKGFGEAIGQYQKALLDYRETIKSKEPSATKTLARQRAMNAHQKLQQGFKHELNAVTAGNKAGRRGTPLTSAIRGTNIARSSRNVASLNITSRVQASQLVRLGRHAKSLGNGLAVIDFGSRIGNIKSSYDANGEWERELFIESSSFAASALTGMAAVNVGLSLLMVATPVGWVGLLIGGLTVAGVAAAGSMGMNYAIKNNSGAWYDEIMNWLNSK